LREVVAGREYALDEVLGIFLLVIERTGLSSSACFNLHVFVMLSLASQASFIKMNFNVDATRSTQVSRQNLGSPNHKPMLMIIFHAIQITTASLHSPLIAFATTSL
jgi:hypothetical protein